jgi:hypothetical protein
MTTSHLDEPGSIIAFKYGFDSISSVRTQAIVSVGGASGGRRSSSSKTRLSASAQCRSSMNITSGRAAARRANNSRSAPNARCRSRIGSAEPPIAGAGVSTCMRTGKSRDSACMSDGKSA